MRQFIITVITHINCKGRYIVKAETRHAAIITHFADWPHGNTKRPDGVIEKVIIEELGAEIEGDNLDHVV